MKKSIKISGLLSALLLAHGVVQAAGLGKLSVQSALGQPLKAEIELLAVSKDELAGVSAQLAGRDLFRQARLERVPSLNGLEFAVTQRANGQPVIRITSAAPMADPFLDLLIELNWSTGRIVREYTLLLDPPAEGRGAPVSAPARTAPPAPATMREEAVGDAAAPAGETAKPGVKATAKPPAPSRYGPVRSGETLRGIASRVKAADVTLEQMMAGLYLKNKGAFIGNNMNLLKQGAVLQVPAAETVHLQTSPSQAIRMVQNHVEEWHAYRNKVAEVAGEAPESRADGQAVAGKITPRVEDKSAPAGASRDVLQLSKGEPTSGAKSDARTQQRLQALEEELAAKARALQESQERVTQLEQAVRDMQQLLELKAQEAAKQPAPTPEAAAPAEPPPAPEPAPQPEAKPAPVPAVSTPADEGDSWLSTFLKNPIYIGGVVAALLLSGLLWMMMAGNRRRKGLNKFEDSIMTGGEFKSGAVFNTGGAAAAAAAAAGAANTEGSMLLTDFSRLGLGAIDTHEVDPIAEAEVYMAYGRDAQAEEILKEALDKDSSRHEIALKLLEIYAARKDPLAFETTASELYAGLGGQDTPVWQRAAEMGRAIDPDNPLYRMSQGQSFTTPVAESVAPAPAAEEVAAPATPQAEDMGLDFVSSLEPPAAPQASDEAVALDFNSSFEPLEADLQAEVAEPVDEAISLDFESVPQAAAEQDLAAPELDMGLGLPEAETEAVAEELAVEAPEPAELEMELPPMEMAAEAIEIVSPAVAEETQEAAPEPLPELDLSGIDLELAPEAVPSPEAPLEFPETASDLDFEPMPETVVEEAPAVEIPAAEAPAGIDPALWEEANTKLDLARAYLEMGDREGAREILQEVAQEGDATQQAEARKLLDEAG